MIKFKNIIQKPSWLLTRGDHLGEVLIQDINWENFGVLEKWSFIEGGHCYENWWHMEFHSQGCH